MIPPADTAICMPETPVGAHPWLVKLLGVKKVKRVTITSKGTKNLKMLIMLFAMANVFTLE
ncbi:hypothetical protein PPUJ20028_46830 [Pseudomonas putida]|uniref:Uncharacterized protein n=1 Tax=Pseudomonas putida TaxID=303 RepID=A0AA37RNW7_PSEPU|nr:hypothetical protein PPUJ20028_46830 [Pseudomonas putida]GLO37844.1 hypothetical protein PPUN14671_46810 [Pseudomonas putida]